jgi:hypothetical protein
MQVVTWHILGHIYLQITTYYKAIYLFHSFVYEYTNNNTNNKAF